MSAANSITLSSVVSRRSALSAQDVDDTLVVTDETASLCYGLEFVARRIWQLLDRPRTIRDLCANLTDGYDVDHETCERDVLAFLEELRVEGLVEIQES